MKSVIRYFFRYPFNGNALMLLLIMFGAFAMLRTKSNFFPEVPSKTISIQLVYPGASPEEIEEGVVIKIEDNLKGLSGLDQVKSVCSENAASITVEVKDADHTEQALQDVKNAVDRISSFPAGLEPPVIYEVEGRDEVISFALTGERLDLQGLKQYARQIEADLRQQEAISQVELSGFPEEELRIEVDEDRMRALGLNFQEVANAVSAANREVTGGKVRTEVEELLIRGRFRQYYASDLTNIVVRATPDGKVIRLGEVAQVFDAWDEDDPSRSAFNGHPSVVVTVSSLLEEDFLSIVALVKEYIAAFNASHSDVHIDVIRDRSVTLLERIDLLVDNGLIGFVLVLILLALFLNYRVAFWVAVAIPISFGGMFILGQLVGITINVISLFAMILVIGILVDDGIVIAENIYQKYEEGKGRLQATIEGTLEVLGAVFSAIVTTVVAFSMFYFVEGRLGDFFREMATVVILTLVFSLIEGAIILPAHIGHSKALERGRKPNRLERTMQGVLSFLRDRVYAPVLRFSLEHRFFTLSALVAMFMIVVIGGTGGGFIKTTFFPDISGNAIDVSVQMTAGTRAHLTEEALEHIEAAAWSINEQVRQDNPEAVPPIHAVVRNIGPTTYDGKVTVRLAPSQDRGNYPNDLLTAMFREAIGTVYGVENMTVGSASPFGRPVAVSLLGNNLEELRGAMDALKGAMRELPELKDIIDNNQPGLNELNITLKPKAYFLGLNEQEIMNQLRQGFFGYEVQRLQRGIDEVRVWIRFSAADRTSLEQLKNLRIRTVSGGEVPLRELADIRVSRGISVINRLYGLREMQVSADVASRSVSSADANARVRAELVPEILKDFPSVRASYEGQNREAGKSQRSIGTTAPIILIVMMTIIVLTFRSIPQAVAVFLLIPFSFIGVFLGHWVHDAQVSLFSGLGIIALIGILVNDALVFVSAYNQNLRNGMGVKEAVYQAGLSRFRPILLTSITTIAGLAPLILEKSFQAQFLIPMAIAIAYGLLIITLIILIILPVYLLTLSWLRVHIHWLWEGKKPEPRAVEPAVKELETFAHFNEDS